jgi:hypothetical protein
MPADFYIDVPRRLVFSQGAGVVTVADFLSHMNRLVHHPDFHPEFNQLLDFRRVEEVTLTTENIILLAERNVFSPKSQRAFVVTTDLHFGLVRMFGSYREMAGEQGIRLFREMKEALAWLALTEEPDPGRFLKLNEAAGQREANHFTRRPVSRADPPAPGSTA